MPDVDKMEPKSILDVIITKFKFHCSEAKKAAAQWGHRGSIGGIYADDLESLITAYESNLAELKRLREEVVKLRQDHTRLLTIVRELNEEPNEPSTSGGTGTGKESHE